MIRETLYTFTTIEKTKAEISLRISQGDIILVAQEKRQLVGFIAFGPFRSGPGYRATVEHTIIVSKAKLGTGIATSLLLEGQDAARVAGHHVMVAAISAPNVRAVKFHSKHGFSEVARMPEVGQKQGLWLDLVLMQKIL